MGRRVSAMSTAGLVALALMAAGEARAQAGPPGFSDNQLAVWSGEPWAHPQISMGEWPWGEQFYDQDAATTLELTNECDTTQVVTVSVQSTLAPMVDLPRTVVVPGKSTLSIPATIIAPPTPHPIPIPPPLGGPLDLYLDLAGYSLHVGLQGSAAPPGTPGATCYRQVNRILKVTGHFHIDPNAAPPYRGPTLTPCDVWWFSGSKPGTFEGDCRDRFRALLDHYRTVTLAVLMADDPDAWAWFPSAGELAGMTEEELLAIRARAQAQIAGVSGSEKGGAR